MKNYIGFVNDHSGSMRPLVGAAIKDYNTMVTAIKEAASREQQDTIVSTVGFGFSGSTPVKRQVVISNPHVLKPVDNWPCQGNTPLYDGIGSMIELFESLPDSDDPQVSFLVLITTDGEENNSRKYSSAMLQTKIEVLQATGRWTFVCRVPRSLRQSLTHLGIPAANIQAWDTSNSGLEQSTQATTTAMNNYFTARSQGVRSSTAFYADAQQVDLSKLTDVSKEVSLYVVPDADMGIEIRPFILRHRMEHLKGAAFYQLTKTEPRVQHDKLIAIRDRSTGKIYAGKDARQMIGLPTDRNARLHPGDHGNYDIFIQSNSVNRKLVAGTGVLYWAKIGVPFTEADLAYLKPKDPAEAPKGPVQLPQVTPTGRPTKSPIPKKPKDPQPCVQSKPVKLFATRTEARNYARTSGKPMKDLLDYSVNDYTNIPHGSRWFVFA